jgi:glycoprotein-N-acetylgalactosamine 3-beta-galactosyltransferase
MNFINAKIFFYITTCLLSFYIVFVLWYSKSSPASFKTNSIRSNPKPSNRILCMILTSEKTFLKRSKPTWSTWAPKCTQTFYFLNVRNITLDKNSPPVFNLSLEENYNKMAKKVLLVLRIAYEQYVNSFDWFLLVDDDTYVFINDLHSFISRLDTNNPFVYGYNFKHVVKGGYTSGGGGTLFTKGSLIRLGKSILDGICPFEDGYSDVAIGECMMRSQVTLGYSQDSHGRERFHCLDFGAHFGGGFPDWLYLYSTNGVKKGRDCCSDETITFHYTSPEEMYALHEAKNFKEYIEKKLKNA